MRLLFGAGVTILALSGIPASAQFGVRPGQPVATLNGRVTQGGTGFGYTVTVPTPHPEFESYSAVATPQTGVCKVWGVGKDYKDDAYGTSVRAAFDRIKAVLDGKYGKAREFDFLKSGALWDEPREWVMAVNKKERTLSAYWTRDNGSTLPDGIDGISLEVEAYRSDIAYLDLTYEFSNFDRCKAVTQAASAKGL